MSEISVEAQVSCGAEIGNVAAEAVEMANRLGITVRFEFNGYSIWACPGELPGDVAGRYRRIFVKTAETDVNQPEPETEPSPQPEVTEESKESRWSRLVKFCQSELDFRFPPGFSGQNGMLIFVMQLVEEHSNPGSDD